MKINENPHTSECSDNPDLDFPRYGKEKRKNGNERPCEKHQSRSKTGRKHKLQKITKSKYLQYQHKYLLENSVTKGSVQVHFRF